MASKKDVTASEVRVWAKAQADLASEKCLSATARGRLSPAVIEAFNKAHPNKRYGKNKVTATTTLPVPHENVKGVISIRPTAVDKATATQARELVGLGKRGQLSSDGAATLGAAFATLQ